MRLVLALLLGALAVPAAAAAGPRRQPPLPAATLVTDAPPRDELDWAAVRARTREYEASARAAALESPAPLLAPDSRTLLARAQSLLGPAPSGLGRLAYPWAARGDDATRLDDAARALAALERDLASGVASAREVLALQQRRVGAGSALALRVEAERRLLETRATQAGELLSTAIARVGQRRGGVLARLGYWLAQVRGASAPALVGALARSFEAWGGARARCSGPS